MGLVIGSFFSANAQVIYTQPFSAAAGLSVIDGDGDANNWGLYTGNDTTLGWGLTGNFAGSRSWNPPTGNPPGPLTPNNFLITGDIVIPGTPGLSTTLSFKYGCTDAANFAEQLSVYVIAPTANTVALITANTPVFNQVLTVANAVTATTQTIDISTYAGQTVRIAMRHHDCTDQNLLFFDDLAVTQQVLSTEDFALTNFTMSPNPAIDFVSISNDFNVVINTATVSDLNGRIIKTLQHIGESSARINVGDLSAGVYVITIDTDQGAIAKKFVKN